MPPTWMDVESAGGSSSGGGSADGVLQIRFRPLEPADVPEVMALQKVLFPVQYGQSFYDRLFSDGYFCQVGVSHEGEIVTVASARVVEQVGDPEMREVYIMTLGVKDSHRRLGLGTRAMEEILALLVNCTHADYAALHVKTLNEAAVRFYESMGFRRGPDAFLPNHYYIDGQHWDAYRYTAPLIRPRSSLAWLFNSCTLL
jgi:ribosomal protein S18 acetylase RimI-like enzyme